MCEVCPVATQAGITPVKDRRFVDVIGICEPVPVLAKSDMLEAIEFLETHRLVSLVATFISESLLVCPYKVAMPGKKETIAMYVHSLVDMDSDKVIKARLGCCSP